MINSPSKYCTNLALTFVLLGIGHPALYAQLPMPPCNTNPYVLVYSDDFTAPKLNMDKWVTAFQTRDHGATVLTPYDYDNGVNNMTFDSRGVHLKDKYVAPFVASVYDYSPHQAPSDGGPNVRTWNYTSASLNSRFTLGYGIYQMQAILPTTGWGVIYPSFWLMSGPAPLDYLNNSYQELDIFEFPGDPWTDYQTRHFPIADDASASIAQDNLDVSTGQLHTFTLVYTPFELDWYVDNMLTRQDFHYKTKVTETITDDFGKPVTITYYPPMECTDVATIANPISEEVWYPNDPHPQLQVIIACGIKPSAQNVYGPLPIQDVDYNIRSFKFYQQAPSTVTPCTSGTSGNVTVLAGMMDNKWKALNSFIGNQVTVDGTAQPVVVPNQTYEFWPDAPSRGSLEVIGQNKIIFKGKFYCDGYLVAKTDNNICNEYSGPMPYGKEMIHNTNAGSGTKEAQGMFVKCSATNGLFSTGLTFTEPYENKKDAVLTVYNMMGKIIYQKNAAIFDGTEETFDLSNEARGVYLVEITTATKKLHHKIILQ
jgi:hypothetical protein